MASPSVLPLASPFAETVTARGRTDVERLLAGELVYTGALRTNVAAVLSHVPLGGKPCPVSSELFAISADARRRALRLAARWPNVPADFE